MAKKGEKGEAEKGEEKGEPEEITLEELLFRFVNDINKQVEKADQELEALNESADQVREMVYAPLESGKLPPELEKPDEFRQHIDKLHNGVGKTIDYVIRLEKTRKKIERYIPREELISPETEEEKPPAPSPQPISVSVGGQQQPVQVQGFWAARAEIKKAQIAAQLEREKMRTNPVVTTKEVLDIVEFGRQLLPALNKLKKWIPCALAQVRQFKNDHLYFILHQEVATFVSQTLGSLISFVGACIEYRKNLLQGRKLGMARSIARIAEAQSYGPKIFPGGAYSDKGFQLDKKGFRERT